MKKGFLTALLFLGIFIAGCSGDDLFPTTFVQPDQPAAEKKAVPNAGEEQSKPARTETDDKSDSSAENDSDSDNPEQTSNGFSSLSQSDSSNKSSESTEPDDKKDSATEENPDDTNVIGDSNGRTSPEEAQAPTIPQPVEKGFLETLLADDSLIMKVIVAALLVMTLVLVWLIYDRNKMKKMIDNRNKTKNDVDNSNDSPKQAPVSPQNTDDSSRNTISVMNTTVNQSSLNVPMTFRMNNLQHIGARKEQQDSFCVSNIGDTRAINEKGLMAVVADGMGGLDDGANISRLVTDTFLNSYNNQFNFEPNSFLYRTAESAELAVENYMKQTGVNGGSTLVAVIVKGSQMNYVSVGDSHIYLLRDNTLTLINKEHNLGALLKEQADRGEIDPSEPYTNPKRNSLTAYIGMGSFKMVDRNEHPIILRSGDKILLCSDGVYNALGDDALISALTGDVTTAAVKIQSNILAQNIPSQDNFTAVILECIGI